MTYVRILFTASALCAIAAIVLLTLALGDVKSPVTGQMLTASALLAASAGWIFTNAATLAAKIKERSFDYLQNATVNKLIIDLSTQLTREWAKNGLDSMLSSDAKLANFFLANYFESEFFRSLKGLGNIIEEMAISIKFGAVDERMLRKCFGELVRMHNLRLQPFLRFYRNDPLVPNHPYGPIKFPRIFAESLWLAQRWAKMRRRDDVLERLLASIMKLRSNHRK